MNMHREKCEFVFQAFKVIDKEMFQPLLSPVVIETFKSLQGHENRQTTRPTSIEIKNKLILETK